MKDTRIKLLRALLEAEEAYYNTDSPMLTDDAYDAMKIAYAEQTKHFGFLDQDTQERIGAKPPKDTKTFTHTAKMYSLTNISAADPIPDVLNTDVVESWKYDGLAISLYYNDHKLVRAVTRGDGTVGEIIDLTGVKGIPLTIPAIGSNTVRGELIVTDADWATIKGDYSNQRNAAAGIARTTKLKNKVYLTFKLYDIIGDGAINATSYHALMEDAISMGFDTSDVPHLIPEFNDKLFQDMVANGTTERGRLGYPTDGIVISIDNLAERAELGFTSKAPRFAFALKFADKVYNTTLLKIVYQVGRYGAITPVGIVEPVDMDGVIVARATLNNIGMLKTKGITGLPCAVQIARAGEVVPEIKRATGVPKTAKPVVVPKTCPACGGDLIAYGMDDMFLRCDDYMCRARAMSRLTHYVSRDATDIKGIGDKVISKLWKLGVVRYPSDLYTLWTVSADKLDDNLRRLGERLEVQFKAPVRASKVLYGLSIPNVGRTASKTLMGTYELSDLRNISQQMIGEITMSLGPVIANSLKDHFAIESNRDELSRLLKLVTLEQVNISAERLGEKYVFTGSLANPRKHYATLLESKGAKVTSSVSRTTTALVVGENPSNGKVEKAEKLKIPIITEEEVEQLLKT